MTTAATTHHRFADPIAMAAAVVVVVGGATLIGVVASQDDATSTTTPTGLTHGRHGDVALTNPDGSRIGLGDFTQQPYKGGGVTHPAPLKGGHVMIGQP